LQAKKIIMIRILSTDGLASEIRDIIREARKIVILISPFIDEKSDIFDYIASQKEKTYSVPIFVITRTPSQIHFNVSSHKNAIKKFCEIDNCFVHYCPDLHAKCYCNESDLVITSLNMLPSSEEKNFELGVHINRYDLDGKPFSDALLKVNDLCKMSVPMMNQIDSSGNFTPQKMIAFCIHTGENIDFQRSNDDGGLKKYIAYKAYKKLTLTQQQTNYHHNYCHLCGREYNDKDTKLFPHAITLENPFCKQCEDFISVMDFSNFRM